MVRKKLDRFVHSCVHLLAFVQRRGGEGGGQWCSVNGGCYGSSHGRRASGGGKLIADGLFFACQVGEVSVMTFFACQIKKGW